MTGPSSRRRLLALFPTRDGRVLLERRERQPYLLRLGAWEQELGEAAVVAEAAVALLARLGLRPLGPLREGLAVDVDDQSARKPLAFRLHPVTVEVAEDAGVPTPPDELIILCATNQATPELDEAWARVGDRVAALPPQFRDEARAIAAASGDDEDGTTLAIRGAALVAGGAPPERVAALRPFSALFVNGVRASARPARDLPAELREAAAAARGAVLDAAVRRRVLVIARGHDLRAAAGDRLVTRVDDADVVLLQPDAVLDDGRLVVPAAPPPGVPLVVVDSAPWDRWTDSVAPPLDGRAVLFTP